MSDQLQERFTKASERFNNSLTNLAVFTGNKIADLLENTVGVVERTVSNITGEAPTSTGATGTGTRATRTTSTRTKTAAPKRATRTKRSGARGGRTAITETVQAKIREGFERGMTTKEIAKFAGVSQSSAVRYTAPLRNN